MTNVAFKIIAFTFLLNVAAGILTNEDLMGWDLPFSIDTDIQEINELANTSLDNPPVQDQTNWYESFLGFLGLGFITDMLNIISKYLYGIVHILDAVMPPEADPLFVSLKLMITFAYAWALFKIFTNKEVTN